MYKPLLPAVLLMVGAACQSTTAGNSVHQPLPEGTALTNLNALPFSGTANYDGKVGFGYDDPEQLADARIVGDLDLKADFLRDQVDGDAENFVDRLTGEDLSGSLDVATDFDRSTDLSRFYGLVGSARGTLRDESGRAVAVDLDLNGDFFGRSGTIIAGDVTGTASGLPLTPDDRVTGVFEADR